MTTFDKAQYITFREMPFSEFRIKASASDNEKSFLLLGPMEFNIGMRDKQKG